MKASSLAVQRLAEQIAIISSEYRKLLKRCAQLEKQVEKLSGGKKAPEIAETEEVSVEVIDKEQVKATLEKMLEELKDID
jgi:hypothetical protein